MHPKQPWVKGGRAKARKSVCIELVIVVQLETEGISQL